MKPPETTKIPNPENQSNPDTQELLPEEIQNSLFKTWFKATVINGPKRGQYKVPFKLTNLPCGCCRDRTSETDPNNTWYIKRNGQNYSHKECGKVLKLA